jgi:hypothetical protein
MQGTSRRTLIYSGTIWVGVSTVLFMLFETIISLLSSLAFLVLLIWYMKKESNQKSTTKPTVDDKITKINYYCMLCGTKHSDGRCHRCASKKRKLGFYISYLMPISSLIIGSGL